MAIRPPETVQRILISTTSRLIGEYERPSIWVTHAWPNLADITTARSRLTEGPTSRNALVLAFETPELKVEPGVQIPDHSASGSVVCAYLSVLFGKRFDNHGAIQQNGMFHMPDVSQFNRICDPTLPQNSHSPRASWEVPLDLAEISRIETLFLTRNHDERLVRTFQGAAKFYLQALQTVEDDPEVAYLHLITAGEILSNFQDYEKDALLDEETKALLDEIRTGLRQGPDIARKILDRLFQVKRRFVQTVLALVDTKFFDRSEASQPYAALREVDFKERVAAAYDLRSRYVHTGVPFGKYDRPHVDGGGAASF